MTIRWGRASSDGTVTTTSHIRWARAASDGTASVLVASIASRSNLEPESTVIVTATLQGGGAADSWTWRRVSGPAVSIAASGATATVTAPSDINGTTLILGVTATVGATTSPEQTVTLSVLPQTEWWWTGSAWIPRTEIWDSGSMPTVSTKAGWAYSYGQDFNTDAALGTFGSTAPYVGWAGYDGALDTQDWGHYRPAKSLSVSNSQLHLHQYYDTATSDFIGACPFPKPPTGVNGNSQEYLGMRWSVRWRRNGSGNGYKIAWMLYGASFSWPDGEIDFPEMDQSDTQVHGFSHRAGYTNVEAAQNTIGVSASLPMGSWHVATTEWIPKTVSTTGSVEFFLDGISLGKTTTDIPSKPMHIQLQTETWLSSTRPEESADYTTDVDWIVVESYTG